MLAISKVLSNDAWSGPGSWIDADMLTVGCNDNRIRGTPCDYGTPLTVVEEASQMSLWCIFASNLMLGSDLRAISNTTLAIIGNREALAVNKDKLGAHGRLVWDSMPPPPPLPGSPSPPLLQAAVSSGGAASACASGQMAGGDFWAAHVPNRTTVSAATAWCKNTTKCAGFTVEATCAGVAAAPDAVLAIHFRDSWGASKPPVANASWSSWVVPGARPPPPPPAPRLQIFAKPMSSGEVAVALLNRGPASVTPPSLSLSLSLPPLPYSSSVIPIHTLCTHKPHTPPPPRLFSSFSVTSVLSRFGVQWICVC